MSNAVQSVKADSEKTKVTSRKKNKHFKSNMELTLLALPGILLLVLLCYVPLPGIVLAFKNYNFIDGIFGSPWVGLNNFKFIFSTRDALIAFRNTLAYNAVFIVTIIGGSMLLAILLNQIRSRKCLKTYQTAIFLPYFLSWSVVTYIVLALLDNSKGLVNTIINSMGGTPIEFYFEPKYWPAIQVILNFWKNMGYNTLLYYAAIIAIDPAYYEAAKIDGAKPWQLAKYVTIPFLYPMIAITFLNMLGRVFYSDFGQFFMVPMESSMLVDVTSTLDTYVYKALRGSGDLGMGAAAGLFQAISGFVLVLAANQIIRRKFGQERAMF